jgi:hypothetical protein
MGLGKPARVPNAPNPDFSLVGPQFGSHVFRQTVWWEPRMKRFILASVISLALAPAALAQSRGGDAALGAVSGAVVFGPVGAVAGAVVGYTAGPSIAHSWGFRRSGSRRVARERSRETAPSRVSQNTTATAAGSEPIARASAPPRAAPSAPKLPAAPPVQGLE